MKKIFSFFAVILCVFTLQAVPAYRGLITVEQPDGTTIEIYNVGDEFFHYKTTEDGYLVKENAQGIFEYAELSADNAIKPIGIKARAIAERTPDEKMLLNKLQRSVMPQKLALQTNTQQRALRSVTPKSAGTVALVPRALVLLVNFNDKSINVNHTRQLFDDMLNKKGFSANGGTGSARDYFIAQSDSAYKPQFDVFGPYNLTKSMSYYGENDADGNDKRPDQMVVDACALAYADGVNFANYDADNDGKVDNIYVFYAGYGEASGASENTIWPHSWQIYPGNVTGTLKYNGKTLGLYACNSELNGKSGSTMDGIGTFCHEFSHVIGMPDYYDTQYGPNKDKTLGDFNLMDGGCYNNNGCTPPNYSAFDRWYMGWMTPTIMKVAENVQLENLASSNSARMVTGTGTAPSSATSSTNLVWYFENRQQTGWDKYLPAHGMLVTKVKYNSTAWKTNAVNDGATMYCDIVEADGVKSSAGDGGDTYPGTSNIRTYTPTGTYALTSIAENSGVISFKFMGGVAEFKVTFNAGTHGTCATTSLTESVSGAGVVLPAAVGQSNYTFIGWSTTSSALTPNAGVAGATYRPTANCTLYAVYKSATEANLVYDLDGVIKISGPDTGVITKNQAYTATFTAASCYETLTDASVAVEVLVGSTELTNAYTYNAGTLTVSIPAISVTDNVSVTIYASEKPSVVFDLDDCSTIGAACSTKGVSYIATITPNAGYVLSQSDFLITMNGLDLTESTDFTYLGTTLTIPNVSGSLVIIAIASKDPSSVDCSNYSYTFTGKLATGPLSLGSYDWNSTITNSAYLSYESARGAQVGSSSAPAKSFSLTTTYTNDCCVSKVSVSASMASGGDGKLAVYVGGNQVGTITTLTTTNTPYDFTLTTPIKGNLEVKMTNTAKALYIKTIAIEYGTCTTTDVENHSQSDVMVLSEVNGLRLVNVPLNANVRIFDIMGRLMVNDQTVKQNKTYSLPSGVYVIQVTAEGRTHTVKAICD